MPSSSQDRGSTAAGIGAGEGASFGDAIRGQTQSYVDKRKADAARMVSDVGDAIRGGSSGFNGYPQVKAIFDQAALGVDELAQDISSRSVSELYDEVHAAIQRRPAVAAAAAALAGLVLFRVLNSPKGRPVPRSHAMVPVDVNRQ